MNPLVTLAAKRGLDKPHEGLIPLPFIALSELLHEDRMFKCLIFFTACTRTLDKVQAMDALGLATTFFDRDDSGSALMMFRIMAATGLITEVDRKARTFKVSTDWMDEDPEAKVKLEADWAAGGLTEITNLVLKMRESRKEAMASNAEYADAFEKGIDFLIDALTFRLEPSPESDSSSESHPPKQF